MLGTISNLVLIIMTIMGLNGCNVGGSTSFVQGITPAENNESYQGEPTTGDWIVLDLLDEPESLNPFTSTSASATIIYDYIYEAFLSIRREEPWDLVPHLVEEMPHISDDHLTYTWNLRKDIRWHDGKPMTMIDADFTMKAIMNPYVDNLPSKPYYAEVDSISLLDDYTLVMYCSQPYFLHVEFLGGFSIMPKHIYDAEGLMDGIDFFLVKNGGVFSRIAELLESDVEVTWGSLGESVALFALEKSIGTQSEGAIQWRDIQRSVSGMENMSAVVKLEKVYEYLRGQERGQASINWADEIVRSVNRVTAKMPIAQEISSMTEGGSFPRKAEFAEVCRDWHDRIEKFGRAFNAHPYNREPKVGSGPYIFDSWKTGQEISLKRNPNYWRGEGYAYIDRIVWRSLTDVTASLVALKSGQIDFMENMSTLQYLTMTNQDKFLNSYVKGTFTIPSYNYIGWRNTHPIFNDKRVRMAMSMMVRRDDVRDKLLFGLAENVNSNFFRYGPDYDSTLKDIPFDPERAQEMLREAGWTEVGRDGILRKDSLRFSFELLVPSGSPFAEQMASVLREDLFMIGVEMGIRRLEWSVYINNYIRNKNFDACFLGWVFSLKGDPKQVWHSQSAEGRGSNHVQFRHAEADSLIDLARTEFDDETRIAMYRRFQQILAEEQPYTFLFSTMRKPSYSKRFKNVKWYPFRPGYQLDEWFVPKEEQRY